MKQKKRIKLCLRKIKTLSSRVDYLERYDEARDEAERFARDEYYISLGCARNGRSHFG